ncbi:MAG: hypothetical protein R3A52_32400 [Polyangiales bacterium]
MSSRGRVALALAAWATLSTAEAQPRDAGRDVDRWLDAAEAPEDAPPRDVAATARRRADAIRALLSGALPDDLYLSELFEVDPLDEDAVARRRLSLAAEVGSASAPDLDAGLDADAAEAAVDDAADRAAASLDLARARLAFLSRPRADRAAVVEAERVRRSIARRSEEAESEQARSATEIESAGRAQRAALDAAEQARTATQRALANERAAAESVRAEQATLRRALARQREADARDAQARAAQAFSLRESLRANDPAAADRAFDALAAELRTTRRALDDALNALGSAPRAPRYAPPPGALSSTAPSLRADVEALSALATRLDAAADALDATARAQRRERARELRAREVDLHTLRLRLIDRLSPARREAVLGLDRDGAEELGAEVDHLRLSARWWWREAPRAASGWRASLRDPFTLGAFARRVIGVAAVLALALSFALSGPAQLARLRGALLRWMRNARRARVVQGGLLLLEAVAPEVAALGALAALHDVTAWGSAAEALWELALVAALYRASLALARWLASRSTSVEASRRDKAARTFAVVARFVAYAAAARVVAEAAVGRGILYALVERVAWVAALPVAALLVRWWRDDIAEAYLAQRSSGPLAAAVAATRRRWYGFFVALAALAALAVSSVGAALRRFVLGYEQTRRALAYLFRRRLERQTEATASVPAGPLPEALARLFSPDAIDDEAIAVSRAPSPDRFAMSLGRWRRGDDVGAMLVVGRTGFGKTTWLNAASRRVPDGLPTHRVTFRERVLDADALTRALASAVGAPEGTDDVEALARWLRAGPRRVVMVDDAQSLVMRGVGADGAWRALAALVAAAGSSTYWLCAMAHYPYQHHAWATRGAGPFREVVELAPWSEPDVERLIALRVEASGYEVVYDDLLVDRIDGVEGEAQVLATEHDYARLIWDWSDGSPRVALHCWQRSLHPDGPNRVRVRLFPRVSADALESLPEPSRFLLAAVVWHESLTAAEASRSLRFDPAACADGLSRLGELGVLYRAGDRYRVSVAWWPVALRFLMRKHLVEG